MLSYPEIREATMRTPILSLAALLILGLPAHGVEYQLLDLGNLKGKEDNTQKAHSSAYGISGDGTAAVGESLSLIGLGITRGNEAFLWTQAAGMQGLDALPAGEAPFYSAAWDVADQGAVVVGESQAHKGRLAFRWLHSSSKMTSLGALPNHEESVAYGVSGDGRVIVGVSSGRSARFAFRWTEQRGMESLGDLPGGREDSSARAISRDGSTVVGYGTGSAGVEAFLWTVDSGLIRLGDLAGGRTWSAAFGVSRDGSVIVGQSYSEAGKEAFRWTESGGMQGLGDLPEGEFASSASAVSGDGATIVGQASSAAGSEAFIWTADGGLQRIADLLKNTPAAQGWRFSEARDISDDGTVLVGTGLNAKGEEAAWLIRIRR